MLHMDEGVGQRKRGVLVVSFQALWGRETASRYYENYKTADVKDDDDAARCMSESQFHASKGTTYRSRFLFTVIPKKNYSKKNEGTFHGMLRHLADAACSMLNGVNIGGTTYFPVCMGLKGDAPMLGKCGYFVRYFATMGKNKGCCHECMAGMDSFGFEDCSPTAAWIQTVGLEVPWRSDRVSPLSLIPGQSLTPEKFYKRDPFHIVKQSLGGHFVSSCIVVLGCDLGLFTNLGQSTAVQNVLDRAYLDFEYYIKHEWSGRTINHIKAFTKEILHYAKVDSFPAARFKGSDTMLLMRWLKHLIMNGPVDAYGVSRPGVSLVGQGNAFESQVYHQIWKGSRGAVQFFKLLHTEGMWLRPMVAQDVSDSCQAFCESYTVLAKLTFQRGWTRFRLEPCLHHFAHYAFEIRQQVLLGHPWIYNPAVFLCEADEDFIGKIARGSRTVHMQSMTQRTIDRYLLKLWLEYST